MRATGIVRRIDDLGRVVIPKELRRSFKIREGDALEIYTDNINNAICLRKYNLYEILNPEHMAAALRFAKLKGFVVDREGEVVGGKNTERVPLPDNFDDFRSPKALDNSGTYFVYPMILDGDWYCAMVVKKDKPNALEIVSGIAALAFAECED